MLFDKMTFWTHC